jgi:hypothetical protein
MKLNSKLLDTILIVVFTTLGISLMIHHYFTFN